MGHAWVGRAELPQQLTSTVDHSATLARHMPPTRAAHRPNLSVFDAPSKNRGAAACCYYYSSDRYGRSQFDPDNSFGVEYLREARRAHENPLKCNLRASFQVTAWGRIRSERRTRTSSHAAEWRERGTGSPPRHSLILCCQRIRVLLLPRTSPAVSCHL